MNSSKPAAAKPQQKQHNRGGGHAATGVSHHTTSKNPQQKAAHSTPRGGKTSAVSGKGSNVGGGNGGPSSHDSLNKSSNSQRGKAAGKESLGPGPLKAFLTNTATQNPNKWDYAHRSMGLPRTMSLVEDALAPMSVSQQLPSQAGYISVFWDIENSAVPADVSAYDVAKKVRDCFYSGHREVEFTVACDISAMKESLVNELNDAHVTVVHVSHNQKNAADEKLRVKLHRFADTYKLSGSKIVLVSGDVDFASELHEMRYSQLINIVLIHNTQAKRSLVDTANLSILYSDFIADLRGKAVNRRETSVVKWKPKASAKPPCQQPTVQTGEFDFDAANKKEHTPEVPATKTLAVLATEDSLCLVTTQKCREKAKTKWVAQSDAKNGMLQETAQRTKVGILVPREKGNLAFWKKYLPTVIPAGFEIESSGPDKQGRLILVYSSAKKAKKACAALAKLSDDQGQSPVCLGILGANSKEALSMSTQSQTAVAADAKRKKMAAIIAAHRSTMECVKQRLEELEADRSLEAKLEKSALESQVAMNEAQAKEFLNVCSRLPTSGPDVDEKTRVEQVRLCRASPVYSVKSKILESLDKRQVVLLVTTPGSGKAVDVASYLCEPGSRVLSIQPDDLAAQCCLRLAKSVHDVRSAECWLFPSQKMSEGCSLVFTTARCFFSKFFQSGTELTGFQCIVVDELEEGTTYQEVILALLKKHFVSLAKIVLCASREACSPLRDLFCLGDCDIVDCSLHFPVDVVWKGRQRNLVEECVGVALEFAKQQESGGNIVVFVPSFREAFLADALLKQRLFTAKEERVYHQVLYDGASMSLEMPAKGTWMVTFAARCPDVVVGILQAKCVVDCGIVETVVYRDGLLTKQVSPISVSDADKRQSFAGIGSHGICYRLYDKASLNGTPLEGTRDFRFMEDIVFRLLSRNLSVSDYFRKELPKNLLRDVVKGLQRLGALEPNGCLTDLGSKLCQTNMEPRVAKLIFCSENKADPIGILLLTLLVFEDLALAHLPLNADGSPRTVAVSDGACMFQHVIELYKEWRSVPKKDKAFWCKVNGVNDVFLRKLHAGVVANSDMLEILGRKNSQGECAHKFAELLLASFPEGQLELCNNCYRRDPLGNKMKVSPASTLSLSGRLPSRVVCCLFVVPLGSKKVQLLNFSALEVPEENGIVENESSVGGLVPTRHSQYGPVGALIWTHQFANPKLLGALEKRLRDMTQCQEGHLVADAERRRVVILGANQFQLVAQQLLGVIATEQVNKLKNKDREVSITPLDSPFGDRPVQGVLGVGGEVVGLLSPAAFRSLKLLNAADPDIPKMLNDLGNIVQYRPLEKKNILVTYKTTAEASHAYAVLCDQTKDFTVQVVGEALSFRKAQSERKPAFHASVTWVRRRCTGIGFATLSDPAAIASLTLPIQLDLDGALVKCERNKKEEGMLYINGLPPTATQQALEKLLRSALPVTLASAFVIHEPPFKTTLQDKNIMREQLTKLFKERATMDGFFATCKPPEDKDYYFMGRVFFDDAAEGQSACEVLNGESILSQQGPSIPIQTSAVVTESFVFPSAFFGVIKDQIQVAVEKCQKGFRATDTLTVEDREIDRQRTVLDVKSNNLGNFQSMVHALNQLLRNNGVVVEDIAVRLGDAADVVKDCDPASSLYVHRKLGRGIRLFGCSAKTKEVCKTLKECTALLEASPKKALPLVGEEFSLLKSFVVAYGFVLREFARSCGLLQASFEPSFKAVVVVGLPAAIDRAEQLLECLERRSVIACGADDSEACPVCREAAWEGDAHRLELCGHPHCLPCLRLLLHSGPLPLSCADEDCGSPWAMADLARVCGNEASTLSELARRSLDQMVAQGGQWRCCPTPECPFVWNEELSAEAQGVKQMGQVTVCPSCTNAVCFRCCSLYHYGMSCDTYQALMTPGGANDKVWLSRDCQGRALCSRCSARLERLGVSSRVSACWCCRQLFCWRCRAKFPQAAHARSHEKKSCKAPSAKTLPGTQKKCGASDVTERGA